jgi:pSer/pThr/pTyr-binding forkhead associated (FHA) protein
MSDTDSTRMMSTPGAAPLDRTMVAPGGAGATAGGFDPLRTQMGATVTCPICRSTTPEMEIYCGDCGYLLSSVPEVEVVLPVEEAPAAELVDLETGRRYRLRPGPNTVGRQGTDVIVGDGTVSRVHARLMIENGAFTVEDLGSTNGTKVGDLRLPPNQPVPAGNGTPLKFGNWRVTLEMAAPAPVAEPTIVGDRTIVGTPPVDDRTLVGQPPAAVSETPAAPQTAVPVGEQVAVLRSLAEAQEVADIPVPLGTITIGRKADNTVPLTHDAYISGRHAQLTTDNTGTYLTDLGSTNGTLINGKMINPHEKELLLEGDEVRFGQSAYRFELAEPEEESADTGETGSLAAGVAFAEDRSEDES